LQSDYSIKSIREYGSLYNAGWSCFAIRLSELHNEAARHVLEGLKKGIARSWHGLWNHESMKTVVLGIVGCGVKGGRWKCQLGEHAALSSSFLDFQGCHGPFDVLLALVVELE